MTTLLLCLALLTPQVDSVQALQEQVESLEQQVRSLQERQDIRRGYYLDSLAAERTAYAAILTVIGALFLFLSFAVVRWRIQKTEDELGGKLQAQEDKLEGVGDQVTENMGKINSNLEMIDQVQGLYQGVRDRLSDKQKKIVEKTRRLEDELRSVEKRVNKVELRRQDT